MNYLLLRNELDTDPLTRGYAAMSDLEAATSLNEENRTRSRNRMTASDVLNAVVPSEYTALSDTDKRTIWDVLHLGDINPFGVEATLFTQVFGAGSGTLIALAAMRNETISRGEELGLGTVRESDVFKARAI